MGLFDDIPIRGGAAKRGLFDDIPFAAPPQVDATPPSLADMLVQELGAGPAPAALQEPVVAPEPAPLGTAAPSEVVAPVGGLPASPEPMPMPRPGAAPVQAVTPDQSSLADMLADPMLQAIALSTPAPGADMTPADPNAYPGDGADLLTQRGRQAGQGLAQALAGIPEFASIFNAGRAANRAENETGAAQEYQAQIDELGTLIPQSDPARAVQLAGEVQRLTLLRDAASKQADTFAADAAQAISDRAGYQLGETIKRKATETFGAPDPNDRSFWGSVAQGIGQVGGTALSAIPTLGVGGFVSGMGMQGAQGYDEAKAAGADEGVARRAAELNLMVGSTEMLPLMRAFKLLPESVRGKVTNRFLRGALKMAEGSGEEAVQEYGQQVAQNLIAQKLYDPERGWNDQAAESALVGAVVGAVPASVGAAREAMRPAETAATPNPVAVPGAAPEAQQGIAELIQQAVASQAPTIAPNPTSPAPIAPGRLAAAPAPETSQLPVDASVPAAIPVADSGRPVGDRQNPFADLIPAPAQPPSAEQGPALAAPAQGAAAPVAAPAPIEPRILNAPTEPAPPAVLAPPANLEPSARSGNAAGRDALASAQAPEDFASAQNEVGAQSTEAPPALNLGAQVEPEPPLPKSRPFSRLAAQAGIKIDPAGPAGQELKARGVTPKTNPNLFARGGMSDVDNIVASENPEMQQILGVDDTGTYLPRNGILDALTEEANGRPVRGADQEQIARTRAEWERMQEENAPVWQGDTTPIDIAEPHIIGPDDDISDPADRTARVTQRVTEAVRAGGLDQIVTPAEHAAIVQRLDSEGGSVEGAITDELTRSLLNAESATEPAASEPVPGFEEDDGRGEAAASGEGEGAPEQAGRDGAPAEGSAPGDRGDGRARSGTAEGGSVDLTTEPGAEGLPQYLVPGTEHRQTGEAQRQKAEAAARAQQSKIRKPNQQRIEDDEGSLFGEKPTDLFATDEGTAEEGTGRKPKGKLSPRFLDFSFTNRASVYGAAFRAAGLDPDEARNLPMDRQMSAVSGVLQKRFGVKVELPTIKVQKRNLVGRKVTVERQSISQREALDQMLDAFRNMQMLAAILGVPERAIGLELDGEPITLSLVSTSRLRGALGMFSWRGKDRKITLPGRSNSFAHEWGHALDNFLTKQVARDEMKGLLSRTVDEKGLRTAATHRANLREAFAGVLRALFADKAKLAALELQLQNDAAQVDENGERTLAATKAQATLDALKAGRRPPAAYLSRYFETSAEYDRMTDGGGYFTDPAEMFARAFEAWVGRAASAVSDLPQGFLSKGGWGYDSDGDTRLALTFPKEADAAAFTGAMLDLSHAMSAMEIFGPDAPAVTPEDVDIYSDKALLKRLPSAPIGADEKAAIRRSVSAWRSAMSREGGAAAKEAIGGLGRRVWEEYLQSTTATLHSIAARQKDPGAQTVFRNLADMIGNDPGAGRLQTVITTGPDGKQVEIRNPYQVDVEMATKRRLIQFSGGLGRFSDEHMNHEQAMQLRDMLTGQKVQNPSPEMKKLAGHLRHLLDGVYYDLKNAGIEVGYQSGFLPRIPEIAAVDNDTTGFTKSAAEAYAIQFNREVTQSTDPDGQLADMKAVINNLRNALMPTVEGSVDRYSRFSDADEALIETWKAARAKLSRALSDQKKSPDSDKVAARVDAAITAEQDARTKVLEMLEPRFAKASAEHWRAAMRVGDLNDFDTMGPTASFLKGRVLPPEADQILEPYLMSNPLELIPGYIHAAYRRIEYARRFGANSEKLTNMLKAAEEGGAPSTDIAVARMAINSATGRMGNPSPAQAMLSKAFFTTGILSMLGRATYGSLSEPVTAGLRSGDVRDSGTAMLENLTTLVRSGKRHELFEIGRTIGLVSSSLHEAALMEARIGMDAVGLGKGTSHLVSEYFRKSLLTPLTNFQHVAMLPVAHGIIMRHLRSTSKFADGELNELGIGASDRPDLLQWLDGLQGLPTPEDLLGPDGSFYNRAAALWSSAAVRLIGQIIQAPLKSDRPIKANDPASAGFYGIMSFMMAFHRNILIRTLRRGVGDKKTLVGKGTQVAANIAWASPAIAAMLAGQFLSTILREALFNQTAWQQHDDDGDLWEWLFWRAFNRTGLTGAFDPLVQIVTGVKYERDIASALAGPYIGYFAQNLQRILAAASGRNSGNTNTAEHNAAKAFYQLLLQPAMMAALSSPLTPGSGAMTLLPAAGIWWGSSPGASDTFADLTTGPKGQDYLKDRGGNVPWFEGGSLSPKQQEKIDKLRAANK